MSIGHTLIGSGDETVVILHGWFGDFSVWEPTFSSLNKEKFTYIFIDYRGYGKSELLTGEYSMQEIAIDTISLINDLDIKRFHLIGHSMGGMAMQRVNIDIDDPKRIKSMIGIDPVPACGGQLDEQSWDLFKGAIESDQNRYNILNFTTGNRNSANWLNYMVKRSHESTTMNAFSGYLDAWAKENFADDVMGLETPTLICLGEHDLAFSKETMEATYLKWLPNSELKIIANAGHYPMQEAPINLATVMEDFINKQI